MGEPMGQLQVDAAGRYFCGFCRTYRGYVDRSGLYAHACCADCDVPIDLWPVDG